METEAWMTIEECSKYLRCSTRYLKEKAANREIPFTLFGGKALFSRNRIDQWMQEREEPMNGPVPASAREGNAAEESDVDRAILPDCARDEVDTLVEQLINFNEHFVTSLGNNLRKDLEAYEYKALSEKVYAQLSRWCHPNRKTRRELEVMPIAHQISTLLFGRVINRTRHPSYKG
ncbi:MAG: excisionase family DNA-binding protein [Sedimentisphaerales bacterium]|jgi:excisionase family DNA binding protein|nr:excisionase family DNA-binding protein [Sedimentisphaerales bacterium]